MFNGVDMVELPRVKIRKDKDGRLFDADGELIFAFLGYNPKTKNWDIPHYLGEKDTIESDGSISDYFANSLPSEEHYSYNIVRAVVKEELGTSDFSRIKFVEKDEDGFFYGILKCRKRKFAVAFKFGDDFDSDEFDLQEHKE